MVAYNGEDVRERLLLVGNRSGELLLIRFRLLAMVNRGRWRDCDLVRGLRVSHLECVWAWFSQRAQEYGGIGSRDVSAKAGLGETMMLARGAVSGLGYTGFAASFMR